jgi:diadenosine tetraphosphatase ApaH/serine/threonine PP2A family protein phosphatase
MRIAVLSDVHANVDALSAVLADIDASGAGKIVCLGDTIGYGPEPEEAVRLLRARNIPLLMGNHEAGLVEPEAEAWFNPQARTSLELTRALLSPESLAFLRGLPRFLVIGPMRFVHGYPPDEVQTYLFEKSEEELFQDLDRLEERICFVGHTHELELVSINGNRAVRQVLQQGTRSLLENRRSLVSVGSVGQPRDRDRRAKYVLFDPTAMLLEVRGVAYDARRTAAKILALGLPEAYASRILP